MHTSYLFEGGSPSYSTTSTKNEPNIEIWCYGKTSKTLECKFHLPNFDNQWVSTLVFVPKKNGKWRIYVDYRELNTSTKKDSLPLCFIDLVLNTLSGKKKKSILDVLSGCNQIQIAPKD